MSAWIEVCPFIQQEYHNIAGTSYQYTGFLLRMNVYINWDNGEYSTGAKLTMRFNSSGGVYGNYPFNANKKQSGKELLGYYEKVFKSANNVDYYYSSAIKCQAQYEAVSTSWVEKTFAARNLHCEFFTDSVEHYSFDNGNTYVIICCEDDIGFTNRKWKISDFYGNVLLQGDYKQVYADDATIFRKYWYPSESELDLLYSLSYYDESQDKLIFDGVIDFTGTYSGRNYTSSSFVHLETYGKHPTAVITIKDTDSVTTALTGDNSKFIRYFSDMNINAVWTAYGADVASRTIRYNVNWVANDTDVVNAPNITDTKCTFTCTDTRGLSTTVTRTPTLIAYTKLTCTFQPNMTLDGKVSFSTSGNYYNASFGAQNNSLTLQYRYKPTGGSFNSWTSITPTINGNNYSGSVSFTLPNFQYKNTYVFQVRAIDKLMTIETPEYTVNATPIFDWSKNDFNFNVPVTINGTPVYVEEVLYNSTSNGDRDSTVISGKFSDYDYVEIIYCDNNGAGWGTSKIYQPQNDMVVHLALFESSNDSGSFYIRHCKFKIQNDNELIKVNGAYSHFNGTTFKNYTSNLIKIKRVLGYRGLNL